MRILAVDPSLNSLGYAHNLYDTVTTAVVVPGKGKKQLRGIARLAYHVEEMGSLLDIVKPQLIVMEGYAMGARGNVFDIGELGGVLKFTFYQRRIATLIVPPSNLKLFATGKGNSDKDTVQKAIQDRTGRVFLTNDEADAFVLLQMGEMHLLPRKRPRNKAHYQNKALGGCVFAYNPAN